MEHRRALAALLAALLAPSAVRAAALRALCALSALAPLWPLGACAVDVEEEGEPIDERDNELEQGVYDCTERGDTGYKNGDAFDITVVHVDGRPVQRATANAYIAMQAKAQRAGVRLRIVSGFRTMEQQRYLYGCYVDCDCNSCNLAARPGYSNHQSGHALDLNTSDAGVLSWLNAHADEFGFRRTVPSEVWHWEWWGSASDFEGPCGVNPDCYSGHYDGAFCDDDGMSTEQSHDRLRGELGVDLHCRDVAGEPAFCASKPATRAEAMFVLGKAADMPLSGHPDAFDDDDDHARERYMNGAKAFGVLLGDGRRGNPDGAVTRSALATFLSRMYRLPDADRDYFDDDDGTSAERAHNRVAAAGLFAGYGDDNGGRRDFRGSARATRDALAVVAVRAHDRGLVPAWDIPAECTSGVYAGTFCDDDDSSAATAHDLLAAALAEAGFDVDALDVPGQPCLDLDGAPTFCPTRGASRADVVAIVGALATTPVPLSAPDGFEDDDGHALEAFLDAAKAWGLLRGFDGGRHARPNDAATRGTLAVVLDRAYRLPASDVDAFSDDDGTANEALYNRVAAAGLFAGYDDGRGGRELRADRPLSRSAAAVVARRAVDAGLAPLWAVDVAPASTPAAPDEPEEATGTTDAGATAGAALGEDPEPPPADEPEEADGVPAEDEGGTQSAPAWQRPSVHGGCSAVDDDLACPAGSAALAAWWASRCRRRSRAVENASS